MWSHENIICFKLKFDMERIATIPKSYYNCEKIYIPKLILSARSVRIFVQFINLTTFFNTWKKTKSGRRLIITQKRARR